MRVVFMGTPEFAVPSLERVASLEDVIAVYTRPDAASGRGKALRPSPVKESALALGVPVCQPKTLRDPNEWSELAALAPDLIVVAAYGLILPREVLEIPPLGCVNVHASLLPRWRGAAPIQRAILAGDETTGVSIMRMEEGLDTGPFCLTGSTPVDGKSAEDLSVELAELGAELLAEALPRIEKNECEWRQQAGETATYADKISKGDVALSPDLSVEEALRRVRASTPQAPSRVVLGGRAATLLTAAHADLAVGRGSVACLKHALVIGFADGAILAEQVKPEGKSAMAGCDFARGARLTDDAGWESAR